jgi:imidazolonepropionase-like amidohydrolase
LETKFSYLLNIIENSPLMRLKCLLPLFFLVASASAQKTTLITNVQIFNGKDEKTVNGHVLVVDNIISKVSTVPIPVNKSAQTTIIDGKGKFLMPGLIDAHTHIMLESMSQQALMTADIGFITIVAVKAAERNLMQGFTTFRDMSGPAFGLKRAIDIGMIPGPRIYPSGAMISQTAGHGDFLLPQDVPRDPGAPLAYVEKHNVGIIADGVDEVLKRSREQLRLGATQLKLAAGGGVSSSYDPLDVAQYSEEEFKAAVLAAENWGTYVAVHAYTPRAIQMALRAGVQCIEHGQLIDDATARMVAEKKAWLALQPFVESETSRFPVGSPNYLKQQQMRKGTDSAYFYAKKYKIKTAFGTDALDIEMATQRGKELSKLTRWYTPFEILRMATSVNGELMQLSGPRNPYPQRLGVIEEDAYADLLLVDGNPLQDIRILENPAERLLMIMKDGKVFKNTLATQAP